MKLKTYASFGEYLADQAPGNQQIIRALRKFVKRVAPDLQESVKWGNGCWLKGLLRGKGKFVRHVRLIKRSDIDEKVFEALLRQAAK